MASKTVLCVAHEKSLLDNRKQVLESSGFSVLTASSGNDALAVLTSHSVDAVVVDCSDSDPDCESVPVPIKQMKPRLPVILLSAIPPSEKTVAKTVDVFIPKETEDPKSLLNRLDSLITVRNHSHPELEEEYVVFADASRRYLDCSDGVCRLLGYDRMELIGMTIDDVSYIPEKVADLFEKFLKRGGQDGEYILRHKTGKPVLIRYHSFAFPDGCLAAVWEPISGWKQLYSGALVELDPGKLKERVESAQAAIEERVNELTQQDERASSEWQALEDARSGLAILRREFTE